MARGFPLILSAAALLAVLTLDGVAEDKAEAGAPPKADDPLAGLLKVAHADQAASKVVYMNSGNTTEGFVPKLKGGNGSLTSNGSVLSDSGAMWGTLPVTVSGDFRITYDAFNDSADGDTYLMLLGPTERGGLQIRNSPEATDTPTISISSGTDFTTTEGFMFPAPPLTSTMTHDFKNQNWTHISVARTGSILRDAVGNQTMLMDLAPLGLPDKFQVGIGGYVSGALGGAGKLLLRNIVVSSPGFDDSVFDLIDRLRKSLADGSVGEAESLGNQLAAADSSTAMQKAVGIFAANLHKDMQADSDGRYQGLLVQLKAALKDHKESEVFPVVQAQVSAFMNRAPSYDPADQAAAQAKMQALDRFISLWQNYLNDKAAGNTQAGVNDLRNLMQQSLAFMPLTTSEVRKHMEDDQNEAQRDFESRFKIDSLDDLPGTLAQLQDMQRNGGAFSAQANELANRLQMLASAEEAYQEKRYTLALEALTNRFGGGMALPGGGNLTEGFLEKLTHLRSTLLMDIISAQLEMPDAPKANPDEKPEDYLLRLAALKQKAADWLALSKVLTVYQQAAGLNLGALPWLSEDLRGLRAYLIGRKLEDAGQTLDAIRAYRQSVSTLGRFFTGEASAARLKDLSVKNPDEYREALQQPILPTGP